jgi:hypothetical protein
MRCSHVKLVVLDVSITIMSDQQFGYGLHLFDLNLYGGFRSYSFETVFLTLVSLLRFSLDAGWCLQS